MVIDQLLGYYRERFPAHGTFEWRRDVRLTTLLHQSGVPDLPGVYAVFGRYNQDHELLHVEKCGALRNDGNVKGLTLRRRLVGRQGRRPMEDFFELQVAVLYLDALVIHWFVSFDGALRVAPAKAQADLLQAYFDEQGRLPRWNEEL